MSCNSRSVSSLENNRKRKTLQVAKYTIELSCKFYDKGVVIFPTIINRFRGGWVDFSLECLRLLLSFLSFLGEICEKTCMTVFLSVYVGMSKCMYISLCVWDLCVFIYVCTGIMYLCVYMCIKYIMHVRNIQFVMRERERERDYKYIEYLIMLEIPHAYI